MIFLTQVWTTVTTVVNWITLTPNDASSGYQVPLALDVNFNHGSVAPPVFKPPTGRPEGPGSDFKCDYSSMQGWEPCSTPEDRSCWLRHPDGRTFDINTDYEDHTPTGIDRFYSLEVNDGWWNADGQNFTGAKLFNNTFPGPWIQACWGDTVHIKVSNKLFFNGTSIHWHGIRQLGSTQMDGVNGVTQCPIAPGDDFIYTWNATQYGSSWYHSHYSVQYADGLQAPLTLHGPSSAPFDEPKMPLLMSDWGHNTAFDALNRSPRDALVNRSIVLNGVGNVTRYNKDIANTTTIPAIYTTTFDSQKDSGLKRAKRYLLRLINTSYETTFIFSIDNHKLQVIQSDFVPIHPYTNTSILVAIGQRYNIIVEANPVPNELGDIATDGNFWIRMGIAQGCGTAGTGPDANITGIVHYSDAKKATPTSKPWKYVPKPCSDEPVASLVPIVPWKIAPRPVNGPDISGQRFDVSLVLDKDKHYPHATFSLNNSADIASAASLRIDYGNPIFLHLDNFLEPWPQSWVVIPESFKSDDWIFLVLNGHSTGGSFIAHPIHLHGHDFAILQVVENIPTDFSIDMLKPNLNNPPRRDVVLLPQNGFVYIAFKTDNPGTWLMHCHIARHASEGLSLQILERQADANAIWPQASPKTRPSHAIAEAERVCKNWNNWYGDCRNWYPGLNTTTGLYPACLDSQAPFWWFQDDSGI